MASVIFNSYKLKLGDTSTKIIFTSDTIKVSLHTSSYTPDIDTQVFYSDLTNELPTSGGYTSGGVALASKTFTQDNTGNVAVFDAADPSWTTASFTARYLSVRKDTGVAATSPLIGILDFGTDKIADGGTFLVALNASGILNFA